MARDERGLDIRVATEPLRDAPPRARSAARASNPWRRVLLGIFALSAGWLLASPLIELGAVGVASGDASMARTTGRESDAARAEASRRDRDAALRVWHATAWACLAVSATGLAITWRPGDPGRA